MKILFVCKHNRFRSQLSNGFFKKYNKNKKIISDSAGIFKGDSIPFNVKKIARENKILVGKPKSISEKLLRQIDWVVISADNVPASLFTKKNIKKVLVWRIPDTSQENFSEIKRILKMIEKKVLELVKETEKIKN